MKLKTMLALGLLLGSASPQVQGQPAIPTVAQIVDQAAQLRDAKDFTRAQALLEAQVKAAQEQDRPVLRLALADLHAVWAASLSAQQHDAAAITHLQAAQAINSELRRGEAGTNCFQIAAALGRLGRTQDALKYFEQARDLFHEAKNPGGEGWALANAGAIYDSLGRPEEAIKQDKRALTLWREMKEPGADAAAGLLQTLSAHTERQGRHAEALGYLEQSRDSYKALGDKSGEAGALSRIGHLSFALSRYKEALAVFEPALALYREIKDKAEEALALKHIGHTYEQMMRYDEAATSLEQAAGIFHALNERREEALLRANLGFYYNNMGRPQDGMRAIEQALLFFREVKDKPQEAWALANLAVSYKGQNRHQEALQSCERAASLFHEIGNKNAEAALLGGVGVGYYLLGRRDEALKYLGQALSLSRQLKNTRDQANQLGTIMGIWRDSGNPSLAIFYGKQSVNCHQELRRDVLAQARAVDADEETQKFLLRRSGGDDIYRGLADLLISQGRLAEAQQVLGMLKEEELFQFVRRDPKAAPGLSQTADLNPAETQAAQQQEALSAGVVQMASELDALEGLKARTPEQEAQRTKLNADLNAARARLNAFMESLPKRFEDGGEGAGAAPKLNEMASLQSDLRQLEKKTGVRSAVLYTLVGAERTSVIFVGSGGPPVPFSVDIPLAELNRKVFALREALGNPRSDPRPLARELYDIVFCKGALQKQLEGSGITNLMWSLDGTLRYIPMPALFDGHKYLVERYSMDVFTLGSLARLKDEPQKTWRGLGLGVTQEHTVETKGFGTDTFPALSGVSTELRGIVSDPNTPGFAEGIMPGVVEMDAGFTKSKMTSALRQGFAVVHIASHFRLRPGNNADSYLLLGDGQKLTMADMAEMSNARPLFEDVDLITLSAGQTGLSGSGAQSNASSDKDAANGAEVDSFGALAQRQGAGAVLATLWPVADRSTSLLMCSFYRERVQNPSLTKVEALRHAQLALLRGQEQPQVLAGAAKPQSPSSQSQGDSASRGIRRDDGATGSKGDPSAPFAHPYFWAPFILMGNWR